MSDFRTGDLFVVYNLRGVEIGRVLEREDVRSVLAGVPPAAYDVFEFIATERFFYYLRRYRFVKTRNNRMYGHVEV